MSAAWTPMNPIPHARHALSNAYSWRGGNRGLDLRLGWRRKHVLMRSLASVLKMPVGLPSLSRTITPQERGVAW